MVTPLIMLALMIVPWACALHARRRGRATGWIAAGVLVLFFPANVYAAFNHVPMGGHAWGPAYLLIRAPLQLAILAWIYGFTIRSVPHHPAQPRL